MIFTISPSKPDPDTHTARDEDEVVSESSMESFPASDPPSWVFGRDPTPPQRTGEVTRPVCDIKRIPGHILERALAKLKDIRKGYHGNHA